MYSFKPPMTIKLCCPTFRCNRGAVTLTSGDAPRNIKQAYYNLFLQALL
jgi:hypothetical protein